MRSRGWLICADPACRCNIVYEREGQTTQKAAPREFIYYHCSNGRRIHETMKGRNIPEKEIWRQFEGALDAITISKEYADEIASALNEAQKRPKMRPKRWLIFVRVSRKRISVKMSFMPISNVV